MAIAWVIVPEKLRLSTLHTLADDYAKALENSACHLVVLEGASDVFCGGLDFGELAEDTVDPAVAITAFGDFLQTIRLAGKPTLAKVTGQALGGGVGLAAACDVVLADVSASFALPELLLGLTPATILPVLLGRMSPQQVRLFALQGHAIDACRAHAVGLVDEVVSRAEWDRACQRWERKLRRAEPRAITRFKRLLADEVGLEREAIRRGAAVTAGALADETVAGPLRAFAADGTLPWEGR